MRDGGDGHPRTGASARDLGVRPQWDIMVDEEGMVEPDSEGMSVAIGDPKNLPGRFRPPEFGGTGRDPAWRINSDELGVHLVFRPDPNRTSTKGWIEPMNRISLLAYQDALAETREDWTRVL